MITSIEALRPKYQAGEAVCIVPPDKIENRTGYEHLMHFVGEDMTITHVVGVRLASSQGIEGMSLYYVRSNTKKKILVPEEWLALSQNLG